MAIAFDAATDGGNNGGGSTTLTFAHTCSGTDRAIVIGFAGDNSFGSDDVTGVTYGGVSASLVAKNTTATDDRFIYIYALLAPSSGSNNVVITCAGTHYILGGCASYSGVGQTSNPDVSTTNSSVTPATSLTTSLTTLVDNSWTVLLEGAYNANNSDPTAGTGSTRRTNDAAFGTWGLFDSGSAITPSGSYSMTTTRTTSVVIGHVMASLYPAGGGGGSTWTGYISPFGWN